MKRKPENCCRCCRTSLPIYEFKTLRGKIIHVCGRCRNDLLEMGMFIKEVLEKEKFVGPPRVIVMPPSSAVRFFRIPFVPDTALPPLDRDTLIRSNLVGLELLKRFPESAFGKPDIAALHKLAMRRVMKSDGVSGFSIAKKTRVLPQYAVDRFLELQITDPKSPEFHGFMRWIIDHGYTLNQIVQRSDLKRLFATPSDGTPTSELGKFPTTDFIEPKSPENPYPTNDTV